MDNRDKLVDYTCLAFGPRCFGFHAFADALGYQTDDETIAGYS